MSQTYDNMSRLEIDFVQFKSANNIFFPYTVSFFPVCDRVQYCFFPCTILFFFSHIILKGVVKIVLCDCDVYPTSYCRMVEGHVIKHHIVILFNTNIISAVFRYFCTRVEFTS